MTTKNNDEKLTFKELVAAYKNEAKESYNTFRDNLKRPLTRAVYGQRISSVAGSLLRAFIIFGLSFIILYPIFQEVIVAIKDPIDLNNPLVIWIPEHFSLVNIQISAELLDYWNALKNNIKISAFTAVLQVASTSLAGYAFARLRFKGSDLVFWIIMLTLLVPPQTTTLARALYFSHFDVFGIFKALTGEALALKGEGKDVILYMMAIFGQGIRAALFVFLFKQFFRGIPVELEESAQIDGAGVVRTFWSVMLPNARGCITTVSLFAFVWQWNDSFYVSQYGLSGEAFPLLTMRLLNVAEWVRNVLLSPQFKHLYYLVGEEVGSNPMFTKSITNTSAFLVMLPLLVGYLFVQRLFIEGVERSGIVG